MKGIAGLSFLGSKSILLLLIIPLATWIITNMVSVTTILVQTKSYEAMWQFTKQLILLLGGSQHLIFTSVYDIQVASGTQGILYFLQLILGGILITGVTLWLLLKLLKITASGSYESWNVFAKFVLLLAVAGVVGLLGTFITFLSTGTIFMPYHGFWELGRFSIQLGADFTHWLVTGIG